MEGLHLESKPLLELLHESVNVNLLSTQIRRVIERDVNKRDSLTLHIDELQQMLDHLTDLLKDE